MPGSLKRYHLPVLIAAVVVVLLLSIVLLVFNLQAQGYRAAVARDIQETEDSIAWMKQHYDTDLLERELAAAHEELADYRQELAQQLQLPVVCPLQEGTAALLPVLRQFISRHHR